jgi:DNA-binding transcriptional LysR family regulator
MERLDCDRMFVAVLDSGSFAGAAQRLGSSSGQASKLVSRLEAELGVQLIKRTTRALAATEVGQAYYERIRALLEEFDALDASVRNASAAPAGRLQLTAPMSFGTIQLAPLLLDFARAFPDIQLDVRFFRPGGEPDRRRLRRGDPHRQSGRQQPDRAQALRGPDRPGRRAGLSGAAWRAARAAGPPRT